jgi:hypothetical protein
LGSLISAMSVGSRVSSFIGVSSSGGSCFKSFSWSSTSPTFFTLAFPLQL